MQCRKCVELWGAEKGYFMIPRHPKGMENGNSIRRDQEKLHLDVDSEDGWLEPAWKTEGMTIPLPKWSSREVYKIFKIFISYSWLGVREQSGKLCGHADIPVKKIRTSRDSGDQFS